MKKLRLLFALLTLTLGWSNASAQTWTGNEVAEGTFYLYNVGAQKYLNNGDPAQEWGTNAYLQAGFGLDVTLAKISDGVYTIDTGIKNNDTQHYLASSTWTDGNATNWTFRAVEGETNVYQIIYDGQYLMANAALNDVEMVGDPGDRISSTYWKLVSEDDFKAAMQAKAYSATDPMDVSVFIKGRSFARNDSRNSKWTTTHNGGNWTWIGASDNKYYGNESWNNTFDVHQVISGLPEGTYEIQCSGFGTNGTTYLYGNVTSKAIQTDNTTSYGNSKEAKWKAIHEDNAFAGQSTGTFTVGDGNLTVGIKRETNKSGDWAIWDEFRLYYYGLDLSEFEASLAAAVETAGALEGTIPAAAYSALNAVVTENNKSYTTVADYTAATNAIIEATNNAKAMQTPYSNYKTARANVVALKSQTTYTDEGGAAATQLDTDVAEADAANEAATTVEGINAAIKQVRTAASTFAGSVKINKGEYLDLTDAMLFNAAMRETGGLSLWNIVSNSNSEYPKYNGRCSEFWNANFEFNQTAPMLPAGNYNIEVYAFHRAGTYNTYLYANDDKIQVLPITNGENSMTAAADAFDQGLYLNSLKITIDEAKDVVIGFKNEDTETDKWTIFRDFKIKFFGDDALAVFREEYESALAEAEAALANEDYANIIGEEKTALSTAVTETYPKTVVEVDETQEKFENATAALKEVTTTFKNAKAAYDSFVAAKAAAAEYKTDYPYASDEKLAAFQTSISVEATSASDATAKKDAIISAYRLYVESNAMAEGVTDFEVVDYTNKIENARAQQGDQNAVVPGQAWGWTKNISRKSDEKPTYADGTTLNYLDGGNWSASSWDITVTQKIKVPSGKYLLSVTARGATELTTFELIANNETVTLENLGADVNTGTFGRGYNDGFVLFEVADINDEVTIGVHGVANSVHQWMSFTNFRLVKIAELDPVSITIKAGRQYTAFSSDKALDFTGSNLTAQIVTSAKGATQNVTKVPAKTGIIVGLAEPATEATTIQVPVYTGEEPDDVEANMLVAVVESATVTQTEDYTNYVFGKKNGKEAFYKIPAAGIEIPANNAYLAVPAAAGAKEVIFLGGETTGINNVNADAETGDIYNISGVKVKKAQKGVYIQNGKKVVVK